MVQDSPSSGRDKHPDTSYQYIISGATSQMPVFAGRSRCEFMLVCILQRKSRRANRYRGASRLQSRHFHHARVD